MRSGSHARWISGKWLAVVGLFALGVVVGAAALMATSEAARRTSTNEFCTGACHSMQWSSAAYKRSIHYSNSLGLRATCADCHIPHHTGHANPLQYLELMVFKAKIGLRDAIAEMQGVISTREKWEQERPRLAREVEQWIRDTNSITCQNCHDLSALGGDYSALTKMIHADLVHAKVVDCLKCHHHVGHVNQPPGEEDTARAVTVEPAMGPVLQR